MASRVRRAAVRARDRLRAFIVEAPPGRAPVRFFGLVALAGGLIVLLGCTMWVAGRAAATVVALGQLQEQIGEFQTGQLQGEAPSSIALQRSLAARTAVGASADADPLWRAAEHLPGVGADLRGLRQLSDVLDGLARSAAPMAHAADGVSLASLHASGGGIDIAPLRRMPGPMADLDRGIDRAALRAGAIDTAGMAAPLADQIAELRKGLAAARPISAEVTRVLPVLYGALGGDGRRNYLLMFQNNAEERASGGNPAALVVVEVDHGAVHLGRQLNSSDFPRPFAAPVATYGAQWDRIYGSHVSTYVTNTTFTPDFAQTAQMTKRMWEQVAGGRIDGVVSFDPVALSYLLNVTGPIPVFGREVLTPEDAVSYLLSDIYRLHPNPKVQNRLFAQTAQRIFQAVSHGQGGITGYVDQLPRMLDEDRLKIWSARADEQALIDGTPVAGTLVKSNRPATVLGVYNNDDATSKMSYYLDDTIEVEARTCSASPRWTVTNTITNTMTTTQAESAPDFVLAHQKNIPFGGDRQWVQLYGPVGAKLVDVFVDGRKVVWGTDIQASLNTNPDATGADIRRPAVQGKLYGRPVGTVSITIPATETVTVRGVFAGGTTPSSSVDVSHTPRVRDVPVSIAHDDCR